MKEIFDQYKALTEKYILVHGWGEFEKHTDGKFYLMDFSECQLIVKGGSCSEELIVNALCGGDCPHDVQQEGLYDFTALLSAADPLPPERIHFFMQALEELKIEHIEYTRISEPALPL